MIFGFFKSKDKGNKKAAGRKKTTAKKAKTNKKTKPAKVKAKPKAKPKAKNKQAPKRKKATPKKKAKAKVTSKKPKEQIIGQVTHYFPQVKAAVIKIKKGPLNINDVIYIKGSTSDFRQKIKSMQIDHKPITKAKKGDEIGLLVKKRVRIGDNVIKL